MPDFVREELEKAEEALSDAKVLLHHDGSTAAVVDRLYYACFHAAKPYCMKETLSRGVIQGLSACLEKNLWGQRA